MDPLMLVLRVVHVGGGVFWAGAIIFVALFLEPSVRRAGPPAGAVMVQLKELRWFTILPVIALLVLVSGFWMMERVSGGQREWFTSPTGMALGIGGMLALVAFVIGMTVMRPATLRAMQIVASVPQAPDDQKDALLAQATALRTRARFAMRTVAIMLGVVVLLMASARYL